MENINTDKLFFKYNEALKVLNAKFNRLYQKHLTQSEVNPIDHINYRIKSQKSIIYKLKNKKNLDYTLKNIEENLNDIAGIRIVCPFLSDIEKIVDFINNDPDIKVIKIKNYIENPKVNGYSSYHMIILVPVYIDEKIEYVKAEIQIRTLAMDVIASLEHKIRYKKKLDISKGEEQKLQDIINFVNLIDVDLNKFTQEKNNQPNTSDNVFINESTSYSKSEFELFLKKYKLVLKELENSLNFIKTDYLKNEMISPIEHIKGRIKPLTSIITKLKEKNKDLTLENIEQYINDICAIKVVCSFLSDANEIIDILNNQTEFAILDRQDYIKNPKECGYSSYHFVIAVPQEIDGKITYVKSEIQVRTIIMDFWANIEHILCYKKEVNNETKEQLKRIANALRLIEYELNDLAKLTVKQNNITDKSNVKKKILIKNKTTNNQN